MAKLTQDKTLNNSGKKRKCSWKVDYLNFQGKRCRKFFEYKEHALDFYRLVSTREESIRNRLGWIEPISYTDALPLYKEEFLKLKSATHCEITSNKLNYLADFFIGKPLCDISYQDISHVMRTRLDKGASNKTVNEDRSSLNGLFKWAVKRGYAAENPVEATDTLPKAPRKIRRALSAGEVQSLLAHCCSCCLPAVTILANTGIRLGELVYLTTDDFDVERKILFLTHSELTPLKGKQSRIIPLNDTLINLVEKLPEGKILRMPRHTFEKHFQRIRKRAGIPDAIPHGLRHTFVSHLVESGLDLGKVKRISGHQDIATLQKYLHSTGTDLIPERNRVQFSVPYECQEPVSIRTKRDEIALTGHYPVYTNQLLNKNQMFRKMETKGIEPSTS